MIVPLDQTGSDLLVVVTGRLYGRLAGSLRGLDAQAGGELRRVLLAHALDPEPELLILDEPTAGLDPITAENICSLINEFSAGEPPDRTGLIVVTHDVTAAVKIAERFLYLRNGMIVFDGSANDLKNTNDAGLRAFIKEIL